ncbi:acyl-CoA carboxylase subunit epsilon [Kribbella sp. NPDC056951]|uniref:acyl-CoA carboxylase subunit epsilon n=1 Tax=Kribbella sp. NPDC056951 TaxID=3345978 RepID=UPI00363B3C9A
MSDESGYDGRVKDILDRVAKGHLSPEEATTLISALRATEAPVADATPSPSAWADAVDAPVPPAPASVVDEPKVEVEEEIEHSTMPIPSGVQRVTIRAIGRRVRLIGEPAVTGVAVDGPHVIKRDGDTLAINSEGDMGVSIDGFSMLRNPTDLKAHVNGLAKELQIRVNPNLDVEVEVTGGSVNSERVYGLSRVRVTAGTAKVVDVEGPIDVLVQAGSVTVDGQITKGRSRVRVESGMATVNLRRGSDVHVHTEAQLGRVNWTGAVSGQSKDVEIGRGRAGLDVEVLVGSAQISAD